MSLRADGISRLDRRRVEAFDDNRELKNFGLKHSRAIDGGVLILEYQPDQLIMYSNALTTAIPSTLRIFLMRTRVV